MPELLPFIPAPIEVPEGILGRYLLPASPQALVSWLQERLPTGAWILEPFGASPQHVLAAARAGYNVLCSAGNPIGRQLIEMAANPPTREELRTALAELAGSRLGDERLELHIRGLYRTQCQQCGQWVEAQAFLWEKDAPIPYAKIYQCQACGDAGERPADAGDASQARRFSMGGLHKARALQRVTGLQDPDRQHAEEAVNAYLPRAIYILLSLSGLFDSPSTSEGLKKRLAVLLLHAFDQGSSLWPADVKRPRPRQLVTPARFLEKNLWLALEQALDCFAETQASIPLTIWPELPTENTGSIVLFEGRLKDLQQSGAATTSLLQSMQAAVAALPRPNQAFWTLSALWAGWLWGREASGPFKSVLRRRRYDWAWHCAALSAAFQNLAALLPQNFPFFGLVDDLEPGFLAAAVLAGETAGMQLTGLALRESSEQAQIHWSVNAEARATVPAAAAPRTLEQRQAQVEQTTQAYLQERGEPAPYLLMQACGLQSLAGEHTLTQKENGDELTPEQVYEQVETLLGQAFTFRNGFLRFGGSEKTATTGLWWHKALAQTNPSLMDRVEMSVVKLLVEAQAWSQQDVERGICSAFPGLLTPAETLVMACLESYAIFADGVWRLREEDQPARRRADLRELEDILQQMAKRMGFLSQQTEMLTWLSPNGERYYFYLRAGANLSRLLLAADLPEGKRIIALPGGRASLVQYKLAHDPRLAQAAAEKWQLIKFRHLRRLATEPDLLPEKLEQMLFLDPLAEDSAQMRML